MLWYILLLIFEIINYQPILILILILRFKTLLSALLSSSSSSSCHYCYNLFLTLLSFVTARTRTRGRGGRVTHQLYFLTSWQFPLGLWRDITNSRNTSFLYSGIKHILYVLDLFTYLWWIFAHSFSKL